MINLMNEPEILERDKNKPQILDADTYVENAHRAVGYASRCWGKGEVFDTTDAMRIANELCAYMRLLKEGKGE